MKVEIGLKVYFEDEFYKKTEWLVRNYEKEIAGFIIGKFTEDSKIICEDLIFHEQEVGQADVDVKGKALVKLRKEYGDKCLKIIGHFHSHNTLGAGFSGVDNDMIKEFMIPREKGIFVVGSTSGYAIRVEMKKPINITINELDYYLNQKEDEELSKEMKKVVKEKVKEREYKTYQNVWYDRNFGYNYPKEINENFKPDNLHLTNKKIDKKINNYVNEKVRYLNKDKKIRIEGFTTHTLQKIEEFCIENNINYQIDVPNTLFFIDIDDKREIKIIYQFIRELAKEEINFVMENGDIERFFGDEEEINNFLESYL